MNKNQKYAHNNKERELKFLWIQREKIKKCGVEQAASEIGEDSTKYGEFISSYFAWTTLQGQKENVEELQEITKKDKKEK